MRKNFWNIATVLLAISSILISFYYYKDNIDRWESDKNNEKMSNYKSISISEKSYRLNRVLPANVLGGESHGAYPDKLSLMYDGVPIENYVRIVLMVRNDGNIPIKPSDYVEPIRVRLRGIKDFLSIHSASSGGINVEVQINDGIIEIESELLNVGDSYNIEIEANISKDEGSYRRFIEHVEGRIIGVKEVYSVNKIPNYDFSISNKVNYSSNIIPFIFILLSLYGFVSILFKLSSYIKKKAYFRWHL